MTTPPVAEQAELDGAEDLPVVARMVIEIRSDGSRTIARGAVEDLINDQRVAVDARADSPLELSRALMQMLLSAPLAAGSALLGRGDTSRKFGSADTPTGTTGSDLSDPVSLNAARALPAQIRARARALRRSIGERVERSLQARLRDAIKQRR
jgi:hypothetical protein